MAGERKHKAEIKENRERFTLTSLHRKRQHEAEATQGERKHVVNTHSLMTEARSRPPSAWVSGGAVRPARGQLRATVVTSWGCAATSLRLPQRPPRRDAAEVLGSSGSQEHWAGQAATAGSRGGVSSRRHSGSSRGSRIPLPPPACPPVSLKSPMGARGGRGQGSGRGGRA